MNNKVYYGEYSLKHWMNLILKKNIRLPEYQRYFVWDKNKTKELINAFRDKQFVPPVTIGNFNDNGDSINLILDGQQRLTSILLAYIGIFPDKNNYAKNKERGFADEDDNPIDESLVDNILEWNFNQLIEKGNDKNIIREKIVKGNYEEFYLDVDEDFFENNFLGFSYLVLQGNDEKSQQKFYSKVFRNINIQGVSLIPQESRESLYYLDKDLEEYFKPELQNKILVNDSKIDFVRYLSLLSQYKKDNSSDNLARGFARKMEKYYEEYIYFCIGDEKSDLFVIKTENYKESFEKLHNTLKELDLFKEYDSIIDVDIALFGLIYFIVFEEKKINCRKKDEIIDQIENKVKEFKKENLHTKNPSAFKYLRARVASSIDIYEEYINE